MTATLETRVIALERRCRRLQLALLALGAVSAAACLSGALGRSSVLRAERFELVDASGAVHGGMVMDGKTPRLVLVSPENESLVALCAGPSVLEGQALKDGGLTFQFGEGETTTTEIPFTVDPAAAPRKHGIAALTLAGPGSSTELVVDRESTYLHVDADGQDIMLGAGAATDEDEAFCALHMCADAGKEKSFGCATLGASPTGGRLDLGAQDVNHVELVSEGDAPSLTLRKDADTAVFHAP